MIKKQDENQAGGKQSTERPQERQQKPEQQIRNRANNHRPNSNQRVQNQPRHQGSEQNVGGQTSNSKDGQARSAAQSKQGGNGTNKVNNQSQTRSAVKGMRNQNDRHDGHFREGSQSRGYYRDKSGNNDRDSQPRQYAGSSSSKYGSSLRNRAEETIDDIKEDIVRLEKEINLEIKEIKSLKL